MPTYQIDGPDGKTYEIDGPEGATREQIIERVQASLSSAKPDVNPAVDAIRSIPGGAAQGVAAMAGLPGDLRELGNKASGAINKFLGGPGTGPASKSPPTSALGALALTNPFTAALALPLPTSKQANDTFSAPTGGYYKPQTMAGEYAQTISSFLPNALAPGSLPARAARVIVPGAASETAGQLTKGKPYEGAARAIGGLAGGIGEGMAEGAISRPSIMSPAELDSAKNAAYKAANDAGVVIVPNSFQKFATDLGADITRNNVVQKELHPKALAAIDTIQQEAASGVPITLERADAIRQAVRGAAEGASSQDARIVKKVRDALDSYLDGLTPADTMSGDASVAVPILKEARSLAQRQFKSEQIQKIIDLAENQAAGNNSALGTGQALRQQFKNLNAQLIKDPVLAKSFTDVERSAISRVVNGGPVENALRLFGKLAPTNAISMGVGPSLGAAVGAGIGGPAGAAIGAVGVPALGAASRGGASLLTQRNARLAEELMRAGPGSAQVMTNPGITNLALPLLLARPHQ